MEVDQDLEADVVTPGEEALEVEALENWEKMIIIFLGENFGICKVFLFFTCPSSSDWGGGGKGSSGVTSTILRESKKISYRNKNIAKKFYF